MNRASLIILLLLIGVLTINAQQAYKMTLLSHFNNPNLPKVDVTDIWNDCTGWYDKVKDREYIIAGSTDSIYFFDITDPSKMLLVDVRFGKSFFARNRDYETYSHYAYCAADQGSGVGALQVFDLRYLPDSVHLVYESNEFLTFSHTIFIDSASKRLYSCSNTSPKGFSAMDILSLVNPEKPTFLASLQVPLKGGGVPLFRKVHEMYPRNDTVYLSCEEDGLFIFDLRSLTNQIFISSITSYPEQGFNHSPWLDVSGRLLMFTDENTGLDAKIFDISNLSDPKLVSMFNSSPLALPHNAYWKGDVAIVSSYHDGVRVWDLRDPKTPTQVAWYDTHPVEPEEYGGYKGCWGVYPFLPSGNIIASDLTSGIFLLKIDSNFLSAKETLPLEFEVNIYPNPSNDKVFISTDKNLSFNVNLVDMTGKVLKSDICHGNKSDVDVSDLQAGFYFLEIISENKTLKKKIFKY